MSVIRRLPRYYRYLEVLERSGVNRISSRALSEKMGFTASQIRQDFNCFGGFGQQGYGYNVSQLRENIGNILGTDKKRKSILIGAGNLGRALLSMNFEKMGISMTGVFDVDKKLIGTKIRDYEILDYSGITEFCKKNEPVMAIVCIPSSAAAEVTDKLCDCGIKGFWNFSHYDIAIAHPDVHVESVHLNDSLMTLSYQLG